MANEEEPKQERAWVKGIELLVGGAAIFGGTTYVLINALYVRFYGYFGIRPEDVGWDRFAVLARAAWFVIFALCVGAIVGFYHVSRPVPSRRPFKPRQLFFVPIFLYLAILPAFILGMLRVDALARRVAEGESIDGANLIGLFIDVSTNRTEVVWLGDEDKQPPGLDSPYLAYFGRSEDVAVLLACGTTTIVVPADQIAVQLVDQGKYAVDPEQQGEQERQEFDRVCNG